MAPILESQRKTVDSPATAAYGICDIGHQGLMHDKEFGLIYNRARYLSPKLGRFLQRDPLGYVDGMSLYESRRSAPTTYVDWIGGPSMDPSTGDIVSPDGRRYLGPKNAQPDYIGQYNDKVREQNRLDRDRHNKNWRLRQRPRQSRDRIDRKRLLLARDTWTQDFLLDDSTEVVSTRNYCQAKWAGEGKENRAQRCYTCEHQYGRATVRTRLRRLGVTMHTLEYAEVQAIRSKIGKHLDDVGLALAIADAIPGMPDDTGTDWPERALLAANLALEGWQKQALSITWEGNPFTVIALGPDKQLSGTLEKTRWVVKFEGSGRATGTVYPNLPPRMSYEEARAYCKKRNEWQEKVVKHQLTLPRPTTPEPPEPNFSTPTGYIIYADKTKAIMWSDGKMTTEN